MSLLSDLQFFHSPYLEYAIIILLSSIVYGIALAVYRLTLHPLARFPGPKIAAATQWYECYFDVLKWPGGQYPWEIERMHRAYGPIVRINPHEIHVKDSQWVETLYASNPTHRDKYTPVAEMAGMPLGTFGTVEHGIHRKRRLANSPVYTTRAISNAQPYIIANIEKFCRRLEQASDSGEVLELRETLLALSTDIAYRHFFGESSNFLDSQKDTVDWGKTLKAVAANTPFVKQFPWILKYSFSVPVGLVRILFPDMTRLILAFRDMEDRVSRFLDSQESKQDAQEKPDVSLFNAIQDSTLPMEEKRAERLVQEGLTNLMAAAETTARIMTRTIFFLTSNQGVLERLRTELDALYPQLEAPLKLEELQKMPWLTAVLKETLRVSAITTSRTPLVATAELHYSGWAIPAKTPVSMSTGDILYDETIFPEPKLFKPERWLEQTSDLNRFLVPFGKGTRKCQGEKLAWAEFYIIIASMVRRFNFKLYETTRERDIDHFRDCFLGEPHPDSKGVRVIVEQRGGKFAY